MHFSRRLQRYPFAWWCAVITVACVAGFTVTTSVSSATEAAERFGGMTPVAVLIHSLPAGSVLSADDIRSEARPRAFIPDSPLVLEPVGRTLKVSVAAGDVITELNAGRAGLGPVSALLGPAEQAVAIPVDERGLPFRIGDTVDVLATFDVDVAQTDAPTSVVARSARVVNVDEHAVTVAIATELTPSVAHALTKGTTTLALTP